MVNNYQRQGSISNAHVGKDFETVAQNYFRRQNSIELDKGYGVKIGLSVIKEHKFDLGSSCPPVLVECKSHRWTARDNAPSAKMTVWNEAMFYFYLAPRKYRKILFVIRDHSAKRDATLAEYYVKTHGHLIPDGVEIWEYDEQRSAAKKVN